MLAYEKLGLVRLSLWPRMEMPLPFPNADDPDEVSREYFYFYFCIFYFSVSLLQAVAGREQQEPRGRPEHLPALVYRNRRGNSI